MAIADHIKKDSPTNSFATLNPLVTGKNFTPSIVTSDLRDGNLFVVGTSSTLATSTIAMTTGKWYWEIFVAYSGNVNSYYGVIRESLASNPNSGPWNGSFTFMQDGGMYLDSTSYTSPDGSGFNWSSNDVLGFLYDADTGSLSAYKNGVFQTTKTVSALSNIPVVTCYTPSIGSGASSSGHYNFGANSSFGGNKTSGSAYATDSSGIGDFYYTPPSGAKALCTANLTDFTPNVADDNPEDYFKCVSYTGDGATKTISSLTFQPDLVWQKSRDDAYLAAIIDSVRGDNKIFVPSSTSEERTPVVTSGEPELAILSNGFKVTYTSSGTGQNASGKKQIAWCWKAGGAPIADNDNTSSAMDDNSVSIDGVLQSNYTPSGSPTIYPIGMSVNTKAGFSIIRYTGTGSTATVPHGLGKAPEFIIVKADENSTGWAVYHKDLGTGKFLSLDSDSAETSYANYWASSTDTFGIVNGNFNNNRTGIIHIAYCFTSIEGFSAFGSYVGNGSPDGPFVYTGFKPAFILYKSADASQYWHIHDNVRDPHNPISKDIYPNLSNVEANYTDYPMDFLSNGFKFRSGNGAWNQSGDDYIYACFSEMPQKFANAR